jgi:hypothetical protein
MSDGDRRTPGGRTDRRRTTRTRHRVRPPRPQSTAARSRYGARKPKAPRPAPTPRWPTGHGSPRPPAPLPPFVIARSTPQESHEARAHRGAARRAPRNHPSSQRRRLSGPSPSRSTRRAGPVSESSTVGGGSRACTKPRGRRRPMTRQLASRYVEGEAAIDRPASLVHAMARCRSAARLRDSARDSARRSGRIRPARQDRLARDSPAVASRPVASAAPWWASPSAGAGAGVSVGSVQGGSVRSLHLPPSRTARSGGVVLHLPRTEAPLGPLAGPTRCLSALDRSGRSSQPGVLEASKVRSAPLSILAQRAAGRSPSS